LTTDATIELLIETALTSCETLDVATEEKDLPTTATLLYVCRKLTQ
jgi:hypothetical protein